MKLLVLVLTCCVATVAGATSTARVRFEKKIWDRGQHNAFTDLIRHQERWVCTFREGRDHASPDGIIRVIESADGETWSAAAELAESGIDLRDPKLSTMPDGRLMMVMGGSVMEGREYVTRQTRVAFSRDGRTWTAPQRILGPRHWLWRVTWHQGRAYGVSYLGGGGLKDTRAAFLHTSENGEDWTQVTALNLPYPSETTLRFLPDGQMIALSVQMNPRPQARSTQIGSSRPPYRHWTWREVPYAVGGPNFLVLPDGRWVAGTRRYEAGTPPRTSSVLAWMDRERIEPFVPFVSGGDTSYPGLVWHEGELWVSYYSSHEGKAAIYLARVQLPVRP